MKKELSPSQVVSLQLAEHKMLLDTVSVLKDVLTVAAPGSELYNDLSEAISNLITHYKKKPIIQDAV